MTTTTTTFRRAERKKAKLRLALFGPAGSGKTYSALRIAKGIGGRVALIDTEAGSGELYSAQFEYDVLQIAAPFAPEKYIEAIHAAEAAGYATVIIDSLSHAWAGAGGILDIQGKAADKVKNSYTAWRDVTPRHNELVESILQAGLHVIVTLRSKTEYVLETNDKGRQVPRKVGLAPVQRDGLEYEFTCCVEVDESHESRFSKDRTSLFSGKDWAPLTEETGAKLLAWLEGGADAPAPAPAAAKPAAAPQTPGAAPPADPERAALLAWLWKVASGLGVKSGDFGKWCAAQMKDAGVDADSIGTHEGREKMRRHVEKRFVAKPEAEPAPASASAPEPARAPSGASYGTAIGTTPDAADPIPF